MAELKQELTVIDQRGRLLGAALGFAGLRDAPPDAALDRLHTWLDSWSGIGHAVAGMARQGYDLELRRYDGQGWRAMFFPSGFEHSFTSRARGGWAPSPWQAVQDAARDALDKLHSRESPTRDWTMMCYAAFRVGGPLTVAFAHVNATSRFGDLGPTPVENLRSK